MWVCYDFSSGDVVLNKLWRLKVLNLGMEFARKDGSHRVVRTDDEDPETCPKCPHGLMILFEKKKGQNVERFFACAAFRSKKDCAFFLEDDDPDKLKKIASFAKRSKESVTVSYEKSSKSLKNLALKCGKKQTTLTFCHSCVSFFDGDKVSTHDGHEIKHGLNASDLGNPTKVLRSLQDDSKEAQYFFSDKSRDFIVNTLKHLKTSSVIAVGTPSILETLPPDSNFYLLDFDWRFGIFYGEKFSWYNMFNHHFMPTVEDPEGNRSRARLRSFLQSCCDREGPIAILLDPPFGGRVEPIVDSLKKLVRLARDVGFGSDVYFFWAFPYFMEPYLVAELGEVTMLDYRINYVNHKMFNEDSRRGRKLGSPIRIFTNAPSGSVPLPKEEGYHFCKKCKAYRQNDNLHCDICKTCPSKAGGTYKHCNTCKRCVKPRWVHCTSCNRCCTSEHECEPMIKGPIAKRKKR